MRKATGKNRKKRLSYLALGSTKSLSNEKREELLGERKEEKVVFASVRYLGVCRLQPMRSFRVYSTTRKKALSDIPLKLCVLFRRE